MTEENKNKVINYKKYLQESGKSENTVRSYLAAVSGFLSDYGYLSTDNLLSYRQALIVSCKASTVNQRMNAINSFIKYENSDISNNCLIKIRKSTCIDNVITKEEFDLLKKNLLKDKKYKLYFLVRYMASTGMRISEVLILTVDDIRRGYLNIQSKGNKERRVYIPSALSHETMCWLMEGNIYDGFIFRNKQGNRLGSSGARYLIKHYGIKYGIEESHLHPHAFRHRFALNFMEVHKDISLLSDLLGHESIETTRIYLKKTADEQRRLIDAIVNW